MHLELDSKSVRKMADRVSTQHPNLSKSNALEVLAHAFGYKNFDTLSAILARSPVRVPRLKEGVLLWTAAHPCTEHGESPDWLVIELTDSLVASLYEARQLCIEHRLQSTVLDVEPLGWDIGPDESFPLRFSLWNLHVSTDFFWYKGSIKHSPETVESHFISFQGLEAALAGSATAPASENPCSINWVGRNLFNSESPNELAQSILDSRLTLLDADDIAFWVAHHYKVNFAQESMDRQLDWVTRYRESHEMTAY